MSLDELLTYLTADVIKVLTLEQGLMLIKLIESPKYNKYYTYEHKIRAILPKFLADLNLEVAL
jgi:hypothetical protein